MRSGTITRRLMVPVVGVVALLAASPVAATAAPTAPHAQAATLASAEPQCGPNNWIGSLVPDDPPGAADFAAACRGHDACYSPSSSAARSVCDARFRDAMLAQCASAGGGSFCRGVAQTYYQAVRRAGSAFYDGTGAND